MRAWLFFSGLFVTSVAQAHNGHLLEALDHYAGFLHLLLAHPEIVLAFAGVVGIMTARRFREK